MARPIFAAVLLLSVTWWGRLFLPEHDPRYHPIGVEVQPFTLTERSGRPVTRDDLRGKVWVVHFFYSQCQGPCTKTLPAMRELQQTFAGKPDVMLVSISVDPQDDTPELLRRYADDQGADPDQWLFLTGTERDVHQVIQKSFVQSAARKQEAASPGDAFIHSDCLLVVDRSGLIDGYADGKAADAAEVITRHVRRIAAQKYALPMFNATLNTLCTVLLILGYVAIRGRWERVHITCMLTALAVSALFLGCYLYFHFVVQSGQPTSFRGEGWVRPVYFSILLTHTVLAIVVAPLALFVAYQGLRDRRLRHVRIARWTLPLWLYVSVTGVVVYWLLYQVYPPY
jgi:protein SCO1/2/putative membrane protein